ncbi:ionotropic receptor 75a-like isoform X2 [Musca autumnalis]|uniref:ionotropic receptor 75a-like isoform X2 n=1 Tax=Musca autumnalis TaxID=221902 RepID=UPI003CE6B6EA
MVNMLLIKLILYNFLEHRLKWALIFNCWNGNAQVKLSDSLMMENIYGQFWNINELNEGKVMSETYLKYKAPRVGVYFDFNCVKSEEILRKVSEEKLFRQHFHWLIYDDKSDSERFKQLFENFHMAVDADATYAFPNLEILSSPKNISYVTYDVYNNGYYLGGKLNMTVDREVQCSARVCELKRYLSSLHEKSRNDNRWLLRDITMRVSTVTTHLPPTAPPAEILEFLGSDDKKNVDAIARFGFTYLMMLKDTIGCQYFHNFTNSWSVTEVTGGVIGALGIDQSAELASSPFLITKARLNYVRPTMPLATFRQVCIFRIARNAGIRSEVYLEPFSARVWLIYVAIIFLIGFILWFTFVVEYRQLKLYLIFLPSLLSSCLVAFGSACCQGSFLMPGSMGGRITFFCLSLLTFIIYNYYASTVVAILLGSPVKSNIKTLGQLAESNLDVALEPIPYTMSYLNFSKLPETRALVRNKIQAKKDPQSVWLPIADGVRRVRDQPGYVYCTESFSSYSLIEREYTAEEICDINEVLFRPQEILHKQMNRNSSYMEYIKLKQVRILESGIHRRHQSIWVKARLPCYLSSASLVQVGLEYTAPLFIMLACVYGLVFMLLVLEIFWHKYLENIELREIVEGLMK